MIIESHKPLHLHVLKTEYRKLRDENVILKNQTNNIESYSRRDNLIIYGVTEPKNESPSQCEKLVKQSFVTHLNLTDQEAGNIEFVRCHRLYSNRKNAVKPVLVRFKNFNDRETVWLRKSQIRDRNFNIGEDFPKSIAYNRRKLFPVFTKARKLPDIDKRSVSIKSDVLYIRGNKYTVDTLNELTGDLDMKNFNERADANTIVIGGMYSNFHPLSNYYTSPFIYQEQKYCSIEQAYQHVKALVCKDLGTAALILDTTDPAAAKRLSFQIKGFKQDVWNQKRCDVMLQLLRAKFTQNPRLQTELLDTGTKKIAESGKHKFYAVGLPITHKDILNERVWTGESKLGAFLMVVRDELNSKQ